jgi:TonB family protein
MRESSAGIPLLLCLLLSIVACQDTARRASPPAKSAPAAESQLPGFQAPIVPDHLRKLPQTKLSSTANYPVEGLRRDLQGRVLIELGIDQDGKPAAVKIIQAEADRVLQDAAMRFVLNMRFDVTGPGFDVGDSTPFRVTVKYCQPNCGLIATFPNSNEITISARRISRQ